jgi:hypothetical protein
MSEVAMLDDTLRDVLRDLGWRVMHRRNGQYWLIFEEPLTVDQLGEYAGRTTRTAASALEMAATAEPGATVAAAVKPPPSFVVWSDKEGRWVSTLDPVAVGRARRAAAARGWRVEKSRQRHVHSNNRGGLILLDERTNTVIAGENYDLSPADILVRCSRA